MLDKWLITIPQLTGDEERYAYVYVPEDYPQGTLFPVLYMFDGHNLWDDDEASFGKSWGMLDYLEENNVPLIVAAVECNHHAEQDECGGRLSEYSPFNFKDGRWGSIKGRGRITMDWFVNEFKPYVDDNYPTCPERECTFIAGSSMGGLMTLYAVTRYNRVFSRGAALSPSVGFAPGSVLRMIRNSRIAKGTVLYMDYGQNEFRPAALKKIYSEVAERLMMKGVLLESRIVPDGDHSEASWEKQIPFFIDTLLY